MKPSEIRDMYPEERAGLLKEQQSELMIQRAKRDRGEEHRNFRNIRKNIARIKTIMHELGEI